MLNRSAYPWSGHQPSGEDSRIRMHGSVPNSSSCFQLLASVDPGRNGNSLSGRVPVPVQETWLQFQPKLSLYEHLSSELADGIPNCFAFISSSTHPPHLKLPIQNHSLTFFTYFFFCVNFEIIFPIFVFPGHYHHYQIQIVETFVSSNCLKLFGDILES